MPTKSVSFAECCSQLSKVVQDKKEGNQRDKERHSVLPTMPLLQKKVYHGNPLFLPCSVIRTNAFLQSKITCGLVHKASACPSHRLRIHLILLYYVEELKPLKTAWEYYNEGMYASTSRYIV